MLSLDQKLMECFKISWVDAEKVTKLGQPNENVFWGR